MWLSIMPPPVGSGCRQMSVATGGRSSGVASSPTRVRPSAVRRVIGSRPAGRMVLARISVMGSSAKVRRPRAGAPRAALPARIVPVPPPLGPVGMLRPDHDMRDAGPDLLVAARAPVGLGRGCARYRAHHPVAVGPGLRLLGPEPDRRLVPRLRVPRRGRQAAGPAPGTAGQLSWQAAGLAGAHGSHRM